MTDSVRGSVLVVRLVEEALKASGKKIPLKKTKIGIKGGVAE